MPESTTHPSSIAAWNAGVLAVVGIASKSAVVIAERGKRPIAEGFAVAALAELADAARALLITPEKGAEPQ